MLILLLGYIIGPLALLMLARREQRPRRLLATGVLGGLAVGVLYTLLFRSTAVPDLLVGLGGSVAAGTIVALFWIGNRRLRR